MKNMIQVKPGFWSGSSASIQNGNGKRKKAGDSGTENFFGEADEGMLDLHAFATVQWQTENIRGIVGIL